MNSKEKAIELAYGEYYKECNPNENGWTKWKNTARFSDLEFNATTDLMRPISLKGIETNNGWIKIESEKDLPSVSDAYFVAYVFGGVVKFSYLREFVLNTDDEEYWLDNYTHYQPIIKPQPPIY